MKSSFEKLVEIAKILRSKKGCPWDREQTIESLEKLLMDEIAEMQAAIRNKDFENLKEEIGDVLFNLIMMMNIAEEKKLFKITDVLRDIQEKIIDRHTWVFGKDKAKTASEALSLWKKNKIKK